MIKKYQNKETIMAEQFDGSDEMIKKYDLDYEYDLEGNKRFYGSFDGFLYAGDWIVSCPNYEIYPISDDVFKQTYEEVKQLHKALDNMIEPAKCKYCDMNEHTSIGYASSSEVFPGTYESANIIKTNDDIGKSKYLSYEKAEPNKYYLIVEGDGMGITEIHYCPVCGRSLNK